MKIDSYGCLVMEQNGMPGDLGDSCAETGRLLVLCPTYEPSVDLDRFTTPTGFVRHPDAPIGWREDDFTSDQGNYLLMAAYLTDRPLFDFMLNKISGYDTFVECWSPTGHALTLDSSAITSRSWHILGALQVAQILINALPLRWSDDQSRTGFWKFWRFTSSNDSTVSYLTVFVTMVFLKRIGITWPRFFFNREKYLAKAKQYYASQPNSDWFVRRLEEAP